MVCIRLREPLPKDPTRPITSFKTAWSKVRQKAGVKGRSRAMLSRYSHARMEAKRRTLDEIAARQRVADEKRQQEQRQQQSAVVQ